MGDARVTVDDERWLAGLDLCDLDGFADGFPHAVFERLRRVAPVWFHPATPNTPRARASGS